MIDDRLKVTWASALLSNYGVAKDKVVVSVPATEQGVHATRLLVKEDGMLVNLAMVAGMRERFGSRSTLTG